MEFVRLKNSVVGGIALASTMALARASSAAMLASDNAGNYSTSTYSGQNEGTGFQAWTGGSADSEFGTGTAGNEGGDDPTAIESSSNSEDFGIHGGPGQAVTRAFLNDSGGTTGVALDVGQSYTWEMAVRATTLAPIVTLGSSSQAMFTFEMATAGDADWSIIDNSGTYATRYPIEAGDPMDLTFTLTSSTTYSFSVQDLATSSPQATYTTSGTLANAGNISQFKITPQGNNNNDVWFNNLVITPEPTSLGLLCLGAAGLIMRRHRRSPA